jgi:hypothetical protein
MYGAGDEMWDAAIASQKKSPQKVVSDALAATSAHHSANQE